MIGLTQEITVLPSDGTVTTSDAEGNPTVTAGEPLTYAGWLQRRQAVEVDGVRTVERTGWVLFLPPGAQISAADTVEVEGRRYAVDGEPDRVRTPGGEHHVEADLTLVDA